ncbi:MAG: hypothetical protein NTY94_01795 [Alphaproteobacteria bacterium]|nr:hypothetical protein [Alphaproteobacteria bacterium]
MSPTPWTRQDTLIAVALAAASIAVVALINAGFSAYASPWIGDSPAYMEAARSLLRGEPLYNRFGFDPPTPIYLWPPGFPTLIALVSLTGLGVLQAGMVLSAGGVAAAVPAAYWAVRPALGRWAAGGVAMLCLSGPGIILYANTFGTEPVFLCLVLLALGCMIRGRFLVAGFVVGLSLLLRNTGLALVPALGIAILVGARGLGPVRAAALRAAAGLAGPVLVLVLFNVLAHGTLRPYIMAPSTRPLALILQDMGRFLTFAVVPSTTLAEQVPWILPLAGSVLVCLAALAVALWRSDMPLALRRAHGAIATYALGGIAITVLGRLRYEWGAEITVRHASQYDWAILSLAAAVAAMPLLRWARPAGIAIAGVAATIIVLRAGDVVARFDILRASDPLVAETIATGSMPDHPLAKHIQVRQFFRHYEAREDLRSIALTTPRTCRVVASVFEVLVTQYDIHATQPRLGMPAETSTMVIDALLPAAELGLPGALPPAFRRVLADRLPPAIKVYTNDPERCLAP